MSVPVQTMREQLEGAFDESDETESGSGGEEEQGQEAGGSEENSEESVRLTPEEQEGSEASEESSVDDKGGDDEAGDAKSVSGEEDASESGDAEDGHSEENSAASGVKPPASWKPNAREHWAKIPAEAQKEIQRREKHMDNMVRESADSRKQANEFKDLVRPYEGMIASQNSTPMKAVSNLMQTAAGLTMGSPQQKANIMVNIIDQYGIDIETLDRAIVSRSGGTPSGGNGQANTGVAQMIANEMAPVKQFMGQMNTQRQEYANNQQVSMDKEIADFSKDPKNEFFEDVRGNMADLMELAGNRNEALSIQDAYDRACRMDGEINTIINKRSAASSATSNNANVANKKNAASSVHGKTRTNPSHIAADSLRGAINDAWDDAS